MRLPSFSIAAKLYAIFALLATATVALAVVAVLNARRHAALTGEFEAAFAGAINVERVNTLIYAAEMESRGILWRRTLGGEALQDSRVQPLASNAAVMWRGMRPGATSMTSRRMSRMLWSG